MIVSQLMDPLLLQQQGLLLQHTHMEETHKQDESCGCHGELFGENVNVFDD